jgi:4-amino-4-deoxy-L-arabinose transferase-like glycosyltransferase
VGSDRAEKLHWTSTRAFWVIAAVFVVALYFFGLTIPLVGPDEPRYAQVAREMFERGDWVTPTLGGFDWFEKPALLYWLQIASYNIFGVSELAARFGSAIFGLGTIASLWLLGRSVEREHNGFSFANLLGLIAASSLGIIVFSRGASFDIILTFPITAALVSFFIFDRAETRPLGSVAIGRTEIDSASSVRSPRSFTLAFPPGTAALVGFYFFVGVAILAKGLVGIVFPYAIVTFYHLLAWKRPRVELIVSLFWGTLLAAAVASLWYVPMYLVNGWKFIDEFFIQHHFQRYTSNKYFHPQPFYFFFWVLPLMTIPWLPFFFAGLWKGMNEIFQRNDARQQRGKVKGAFRSLLLFAFAWLLVPLVFFSFSGSKLPGYIMPAVPAALIIAALYVWRFVGESDRRRTLVVGLGAATFAVITALLVAVVPKYADDDSVKRLIAEADARGYRGLEVLSQHALSHNAEFYAAGRLLRDDEGKQRRLYGPHEILNEIRRRSGETVLVLVPNEWVSQTLESPLLECEVIAKNGENTILAAREKSLQP